MTEYLKQIEKNTQPKSSLQIIVSGNKNIIFTEFVSPIELDREEKYEIALINLETYYSFPNIDSTNNKFWYSKEPDEGEDREWNSITIPEGTYELRDIDLTIRRLMKNNGDYDLENDQPNISILANNNTLKSILILKNGYQVDFTADRSNTIASVLGFDQAMYTAERQESENIVNIISINSIHVKINLISGSYVDGQEEPVIYSFFPNVSPGYKIVETPSIPVYLPVILYRISKMTTSVTSQDGVPLKLRNEKITIRFHLREMYFFYLFFMYK